MEGVGPEAALRPVTAAIEDSRTPMQFPVFHLRPKPTLRKGSNGLFVRPDIR